MSEFSKWLDTLSLYNVKQPAIPLPRNRASEDTKTFRGPEGHPYLIAKPIPKLTTNEVSRLPRKLVIDLLNRAGIETDVKTGLFESFKLPTNIDMFGEIIKNNELNLAQYIEYLARITSDGYIPVKRVEPQDSIKLLIGHLDDLMNDTIQCEYVEYEDGVVKFMQNFSADGMIFYYDQLNECCYWENHMSFEAKVENIDLVSYGIVYTFEDPQSRLPQDPELSQKKVLYVKYRVSYFTPIGKLRTKYVSTRDFNEILKRVKQDNMIKVKAAVDMITHGLIKLDLVKSIIVNYL
jgi:hypothetical protein